MITDIALLLVLFLLNGIFAMSEIAVVSSRRARLVQMAETSGGARRALALASEPTRFLSSVQVGITCIGILSGAIGEASFGRRRMWRCGRARQPHGCDRVHRRKLPSEPGEEPAIVRRDDGSWLLDGALDLDTVLRTLDAESLLSDEDRQHYHTLGGLAMLALGHVPRTGDVFERGDYRFEIVDMDGNRVDRVLANRTSLASKSDVPPTLDR